MTFQILAQKLILLNPFEICLHFFFGLFLQFLVFQRALSELDQPMDTFYQGLQVLLEKSRF
jgi:hypothetical protein